MHGSPPLKPHAWQDWALQVPTACAVSGFSRRPLPCDFQSQALLRNLPLQTDGVPLPTVYCLLPTESGTLAQERRHVVVVDGVLGPLRLALVGDGLLLLLLLRHPRLRAAAGTPLEAGGDDGDL